MTRRRQILLMVGILGIVAAGVGAVAHSSGPSAPPTPALEPPPQQLVRVKEVTAESADASQSYTGVVRARYETDLAFRVGAKIVSRHVEVGQRVSARAL